jgi:hypothetical protein
MRFSMEISPNKHFISITTAERTSLYNRKWKSQECKTAWLVVSSASQAAESFCKKCKFKSILNKNGTFVLDRAMPISYKYLIRVTLSTSGWN